MTVIEAIEAGDLDALQEILAAEPAWAAARNSEGVPALRLAVYFFRPGLAEALRAAGAPLDFHTAAALGEIVDGDVSSYSEDGWTALHLAAFFGRPAAVEALLAKGANVRARSTNQLNNLPIHAAAARKHAAIVEMLIRAGSPVDETQTGGFTPLHSAAQNGDLETARLLLAAGADPRRAAGAGQTPASLAAEKGFTELAALLGA
jgi:ankyrin repeat protein